MLGRKQIPTKLKLIQGKQIRKKKNEPQPEVKIPSRPKWLLPAAKNEWKRLAKELERLGLLTRIDRAALAAYCQEYALYVKNQEIIQEYLKLHGTTSYRSDKGNMVMIPQTYMATMHLKNIIRIGGEFGLSPSSRGRLEIPENLKPKNDDEFFE